MTVARGGPGPGAKLGTVLLQRGALGRAAGSERDCGPAGVRGGAGLYQHPRQEGEHQHAVREQSRPGRCPQKVHILIIKHAFLWKDVSCCRTEKSEIVEEERMDYLDMTIKLYFVI